MKGNGGVALIFALLVLSFITIVGGALLTTATIDIWISDNHKTAIQSLYLAEAGIDQAREVLRTSSSTPTELLTSAAGPDGQLLASADLATLLDGDDQPLIPSDPSLRQAGQPLLDNSVRMIGRYYVWLRNDNADGMVPGTVKVLGNLTRNGLILIIRQGILTWNSGTAGTIYGGLFMEQTRAVDGSILPTLGNVAADLTPAAIFYDAAAITAASRSFPYNPIAVKER